MDFVWNLAISAVVAFCTSKFTYRGEIKKELYMKKQDIYLKLFEVLDNLLKDRNLIVNNEFNLEIRNMRHRVYMFSADNIRENFDELFYEIKSNNDKFKSRFESEEAIKHYIDLIEHDLGVIREQEVILYLEKYTESDIQKFIDEECIDEEELNKKINNIIRLMKKDLNN